VSNRGILGLLKLANLARAATGAAEEHRMAFSACVTRDSWTRRLAMRSVRIGGSGAQGQLLDGTHQAVCCTETILTIDEIDARY